MKIGHEKLVADFHVQILIRTFKSHRRQPADHSILTYRTLKTLLNPTGGSRWMVHSLPVRSTTGNRGGDWTIHRLPPVGFRGIFLVLGRLGLNHPPAAAGGIYKARTCANTNGGRGRRLISGVSTAENTSLDM